MKIRFFGGANEVGASSTLIEIDDYRILLDAGIRMNHEHKNDSRLPDFPDFDKEDIPDAVLITHAHTDHTGALPVLRDLWRAGVKIYCTPPTKAITRVLLEDSARRMPDEKDADNGLHYTLDDVAVVLKRMVTVPWTDPIEICPGVRARWIRAGHILGAAMIYIEGKSETLLITGDVSVTRQLTIRSVDVPTWCKPDVMVMEATYGNRQHEVTRKQEEKRLVEDVTKTIAADGKVLIPVFSIGRAQEVILILKDAIERKEIRDFPVYVDGMVRDVNSIYSQFHAELQRPLRRKAEHGEFLFNSDSIKEVPRRQQPENILAERPCCIVASSGMLNGGKSIAYAKQLVANPKNLIAITGYQAEGTSGRALEDFRKQKDSENRVWFLDNEPFDVKSRVERYSLSAHADSKELLELVKKVKPREKLLLVHGKTKARKTLSESIHKMCSSIDVELPENGEAYLIEKPIGIARGRRHTLERILSEVYTHLLKMQKKGPFHVKELAAFWFGSEAVTPIVISFFQWCLSLDGRFFQHKIADLYYLRQPA